MVSDATQPVITQRPYFFERVGSNTPPADSTPLFFPGPSLPANPTTGLPDALDTNHDSSRLPLKPFALHQARYLHVTLTFAYISTRLRTPMSDLSDCNFP